jgi:hypothetical protein
MKATLFSLFVALLMVGCGEEFDIEEAAVDQYPEFDFKLPRIAHDGSSELFKFHLKEPNTLVWHEKWLVFTKAQYAENPALYRKMWRNIKIQRARDGYALRGALDRGATLKWEIYDKNEVHLFAFYLYKEDIIVSQIRIPTEGDPSAGTSPGVGAPYRTENKPRFNLGMPSDLGNRSYMVRPAD